MKKKHVKSKDFFILHKVPGREAVVDLISCASQQSKALIDYIDILPNNTYLLVDAADMQHLYDQYIY